MSLSYLPLWCYNKNPVIHSVLIMAEILLMRTKNKAIRVIRNAQVKCYSNTVNLWKHLISRISAMISTMNEWRMARRTVCFLHILKRGRCSLCFQPLPSISTQISSPAALRVTSLALYHLIWENYCHITYTAALSSSRQLIKNKSLV